MKKLFILAALAACFAFSVQAQTVNGIRLSEIKADYIELSAIKNGFSEKTWIMLEYGQKTWDNQDVYVKDDAGKKLEFNSAIDGVNQMKNYGYELFQVYSLSSGGDFQKYYVLKRKTI